MLLAVSGGPDSTALLAAAAAIGPPSGLHVATVDHGLRPESSEEARAVAALSARYGIPHRTLAWTGVKPTHGIQAAARAARYALLADHATAIGAERVLTGHTRDDQAETVLLRLLAGSGPAGLAGMRPERRLSGDVRLARPFLTIPKADLIAYCEARALGFARDPSNRDARFARVRLRDAMTILGAEGLTAERLCRLAERCARDGAALARASEVAFVAAVKASSGRSLLLDGAQLRPLPDAVVLRVVSFGLERVNPAGAERLERLERLVFESLLPALRTGTPLRRTLRAALVEVNPAGDLALAPAPPRRTPARSRA